MTERINTAGATAISPASTVLHACVRAAWQYGHRDRSELTDAERYDRADYYATNALRVWGLTNVQEADLTGPTAWRHKLPEGQQFLGGRTTQVLESLQEALGHKDQFGGELEPLFELEKCYTNGGRAPGAETDLRQPETRMDTGPAPVLRPGASATDYDAYARACQARGVLPCSYESFVSEYGGAQSVQRHRENRIDAGSEPGSEVGARQHDASAKAQRDADEIAKIWDAATANAAMYVDAHCVDGDRHAEVIMTMERPKITPAPTDKGALRKAALAEAQDLLTPLAKEHFNRSDLPEEFLNGLAYGVAAYSAAIKRLLEQPRAAGDTETGRSSQNSQDQDEDLGTIREQASAWLKVYWTLNEVSPGFHREGTTGANSAVLAIRKLAAQAGPKANGNEGRVNG